MEHGEMSEDNLIIYFNKKGKPTSKKLDQIREYLLKNAFHHDPMEDNYSSSKNSLLMVGSIALDESGYSKLLNKVNKDFNTHSHIEIQYDGTGETEWRTLLGDKLQMFDNLGDMRQSIDNYNKESRVYPNNEMEAYFEGQKPHQILMRYYIKTKKKLNALNEKYQQIMNNPSEENREAFFADYRRHLSSAYNKNFPKLLCDIRFTHIDGNYLYVGISLENTKKVWPHINSHLCMTNFYAFLDLEGNLVIRERFSTKSYDGCIYLTDGEPYECAVNPADKNSWLLSDFEQFNWEEYE